MFSRCGRQKSCYLIKTSTSKLPKKPKQILLHAYTKSQLSDLQDRYSVVDISPNRNSSLRRPVSEQRRSRKQTIMILKYSYVLFRCIGLISNSHVQLFPSQCLYFPNSVKRAASFSSSIRPTKTMQHKSSIDALMLLLSSL